MTDAGPLGTLRRRMVDVCMIVANDVRRDPRVQKEARALAQAGYDVAVIGLTSGDDVDWEIAPEGYRVRRVRWSGSNLKHRVKVELKRRAPGPYEALIGAYRRARGLGGARPHTAGAAGRAAPGAPAADGRSDTYRYLESTLVTEPAKLDALAVGALQTMPRVVHCHDLDVLEAGARVARWVGAALVFDAHELWWAQFPDQDAPPAWVSHYQAVEAELIRQADGVITVCDSIADFLADRYPGLSRPRVVHNALEPPPGGFLDPDALHPPHRPVQVLFHGGYSHGRGLEELIAASRELVGAELVLRGFGPLEGALRDQVTREGLADRVRFDAPVPMSDVVRAASTADIGVIPYRAICLNNRFSTPNKLFEYLSAGLAVAASDLPEIRRVIEREDVGAVFDPDRPSTIAAAVNALAADPERLAGMRRRALIAARDRLNWAHAARGLLDLYARLLPRGPLDTARTWIARRRSAP